MNQNVVPRPNLYFSKSGDLIIHLADFVLDFLDAVDDFGSQSMSLATGLVRNTRRGRSA
jgi:hypothetical protein